MDGARADACSHQRGVGGTHRWELAESDRSAGALLGIAFFLKYAFDNNWIKQGAQVGIGLAIGAGLLAFARRTHGQGYAVFAQGLVGAGLAILYLSVYASYNFYRVGGHFRSRSSCWRWWLRSVFTNPCTTIRWSWRCSPGAADSSHRSC